MAFGVGQRRNHPAAASIAQTTDERDRAMAYRFKRGDASVQQGLRRIALRQLDRATDLGAVSEIDQAIHEARTRCKKLRGLIRIVRPAFEGYAEENAAIRDAARALSGLRDTAALIGTYDRLVGAHGDELDRRAFAAVRRTLTLRRKALVEKQDIDALISSFRAEMAAVRGRARHWRLAGDGFDALAGGLAATYKRTRKAMAATRDDRSAEAFHEWRKRAKYHWYHARLLQPIWPEAMRAHIAAAKQLGDLLGEHHDLAVFRIALTADGLAKPAQVDLLVGLIERRQAALETAARAVGARLLAEPPKDLTRRWAAYWSAWRTDKSARVANLAA